MYIKNAEGLKKKQGALCQKMEDLEGELLLARDSGMRRRIFNKMIKCTKQLSKLDRKFKKRMIQKLELSFGE